MIFFSTKKYTITGFMANDSESKSGTVNAGCFYIASTGI